VADVYQILGKFIKLHDSKFCMDENQNVPEVEQESKEEYTSTKAFIDVYKTMVGLNEVFNVLKK